MLSLRFWETPTSCSAAAEDLNASREQIQTIQSMALRLNEIMQRFSSLACEMRINEKESRIETVASVS